MINFPLESDVRIQIDERLKNLGWSLTGRDKNVFLEQPKTETEKRKLKGKRPDYVLYEKGKDNPLIVIETKKKGGNIHSALEQGKDYAEALEAPIVFATDGVFYKTLHIQTHKPLVLNGEEIDELIREFLAIQYLQEGTNELNTIPKQVQLSRQELINVFNEANNILRVEGLRAGIERFSEFANILFLKLLSETDDLKDSPEFERELKWNFYKNKSADEILRYIDRIVLPEINQKFKDENIFTPLQIKDGRVLKRIIDKLDNLTLTDINSDIKGDAFEYFLKATTATGNDLGEYFTPRHIVKMMVKLVNPQIGEKIYDPFCGTGGLLIESFRHIYNTMPRNKGTLQQLKQDTIFGNEITNTARITKMNMILAGDGHSNIQMKNSLANLAEIENKFDVVLTNMPYSQTTDFGSLYPIPTKNGDSICVQHCIEAIDATAENGRIAIIVPEGFLFRKDLQKTREYLLQKCHLQTIISLPQGVFLPYTGVKTNVMYLTKVKQKISQNHFWYFEVKNDGYTLDNNRRKLNEESDLEIFLANRKIDEASKSDALNVGFQLVSLDKVEKNDFILSGSRYKELSYSENIAYELVKIKNVIFDIKTGFAYGDSSRESGVTHLRPMNISSDGEMTLEDVKLIPEEAFFNSQPYHIRKNDVLFNNTNSKELIGKTCVVKENIMACFSNHLTRLRVNQKRIVPEYLAIILNGLFKSGYFLDVSRKWIGQSGFNIKDLAETEIPLPSLEEQGFLVSEINSYAAIISASKKIISNYRSYIDYDEDWEKVELGSVCTYSGGTQPPKSTFIYEPREGYIRLLQIRDFKTDDSAVYIPITEKHKTCIEDDVMIGRYGPPVFQILRGKSGAYNVALIKTIPDEKRLTKDWLFYFLSSEPVQKHIVGLSERSRQSGVSPKDLDKLQIPLPPLNVQKKVAKLIKVEKQLVDSNKKLIDLFQAKISEKINQIWGE